MTDVISHSVVDGVPVIHAPGRGSGYRAGLLFRVGQADETLASAGITHLVEHLALHRQGVGEFHFNGATAETYTHFFVEGSAQHVVEYFDSVCSSLHELPMHRLEVEKEILRTELNGRGASPADQIPLFRYGAKSFGLGAYGELGVPALTPEQIRTWVSTYFTRDNAVLWVVGGEVPSGLRLALPPGRRMPTPAVPSILPVTPAHVQGRPDGIVLHSLVRRSTAAKLFADVLSRALFADLRQTGGYSYTAQAAYHVMDAEVAAVLAVADSASGKSDSVVGAFVDVLARLRFGEIRQEEVEAARANARRALLDTEPSDMAPARAADLLIGRASASVEALVAELDAVTVADLQLVAHQVWDAALVQSPAGDLLWAGCSSAPLWSEDTISGQTFEPVAGSSGTLVVGRDGVSWQHEEGVVTVRYAQCVAMLTYPDGGRRLFGPDGFSIAVEPTLHRLDPAALATIDQSVASSALVAMPARDVSQIPQPAMGDGAAPDAPPTVGRQVVRAILRALSCVLSTIAIFFLLSAVVAFLGAGVEEVSGDAQFAMLVLGAVPGWLAWELWRRSKR